MFNPSFHVLGKEPSVFSSLSLCDSVASLRLATDVIIAMHYIRRAKRSTDPDGNQGPSIFGQKHPYMVREGGRGVCGLSILI